MLQNLPGMDEMYCGDTSLVKADGRTGRAVPLYCRRWTCHECAPTRKRQVAALARSGHPTTFITLTSGPRAGGTPPEAARTLVNAWRKIRRELIERAGFPAAPFLAVFEATKKGRPHLHILARIPFVSQAWLSAKMADLAGSPIVDIRRVQNQRQAAAYVSKYLAKDPTRFQGCKRYWRSQDYQLDTIQQERPLIDAAEGWTRDLRPLDTLAYELRTLGYTTVLSATELDFSWPWPTAPPYEAVTTRGQA